MGEGDLSDTILDANKKRIRIGAPVQGDGDQGKVAYILDHENNDGEPPIVEVQWPGWDEPERFHCSVRDYRKEGPDGPYVYVCEDVELAEVPVPDRLKDRPLYNGLLVPYVADSSDREQGEGGGVVVFGKPDPVRWAECVEGRKCAMCGHALEYWIVFIGGPRSIKFRSFLEPAMHLECAEYAMAVCPWMMSSVDFGPAERTLSRPPTRELTRVEDGDENRIGLYITQDYKVRHYTERSGGGARKVVVYCFANPMKRVQWSDRC